MELSMRMCENETGDGSWVYWRLDRDSESTFSSGVKEIEISSKRFLGWSCLELGRLAEQMATKRDQSGIKFGNKLNGIFATLLRSFRRLAFGF
ncbi:unnamed protein product [Pieris brassicae]|uniref:Uncharacterized protein n=1 Tax=Pieris brassicae TaxID=7116 RepID=A0A9P0X0B6_PIEBR|nr:unnamed protein product [Pieris brassicae]